jgi:uncharacterized cupin superfamily protein
MPDWFIVNVVDAPATEHERAGVTIEFEKPGARFAEIGLNISVLQPGQPNGKYHSESVQEDFLVLAGECLAIVEGEEHRLGAWDFVHCPAGTDHIFVGAGDGPCAILMVGRRSPDKALDYPVSDLAARYGASSAEPTTDPAVAYADWKREFTPATVGWPLPTRAG